jgi:hypothetical protein
MSSLPADAPSATYIRGKDSVTPGDHGQYTCTSGVSHPASDMSVNVSDQNGDDIAVVVKKMPVKKSRKGFTSSISFGIKFSEGVEHVVIACKAVNGFGEAVTTHTTSATCKLELRLCNCAKILLLDPAITTSYEVEGEDQIKSELENIPCKLVN